jgi:hypothetical protein
MNKKMIDAFHATTHPIEKAEVGASELSGIVISKSQSEAVDDCINTAINILNMSDDEHVKEMAAYIADKLIGHFTNVPDL